MDFKTHGNAESSLRPSPNGASCNVRESETNSVDPLKKFNWIFLGCCTLPPRSTGHQVETRGGHQDRNLQDEGGIHLQIGGA